MMKMNGYKAEPNVILCGDATGKATQRTSNKSDYDIIKMVLREANITFTDRTPEANPSIKDRVNVVNTRLKNAQGEVEMFVHRENCPKLKHDLERVGWKFNADYVLDSGKDKMLTHSSDGIGYAVHALTPLKTIRQGNKTKIMQRVV